MHAYLCRDGCKPPSADAVRRPCLPLARLRPPPHHPRSARIARAATTELATHLEMSERLVF
eukprot:1472148-Prymnesium_polylepis.1